MNYQDIRSIGNLENLLIFLEICIKWNLGSEDGIFFGNVYAQLINKHVQ